MAELLKGAPVAQALDNNTEELTLRLKEKGVQPCLAIVELGQDADNGAYKRSASKRCGKLGIDVKEIVLEKGCTQEELIAQIEKLNRDDSVSAVLLMRPLPRGIDEDAVCAALSPEKDVDGITPLSSAAVYSGKGPGFAPCTARACMELMRYYGIELRGKKVVVVGRSAVIGKPLAMMLLRSDATVTVCHSKTEGLRDIVRQADVVVAAIGKGEFIDGSFLRPGQVILDVGMNWDAEQNRFVGDVKFSQAEELANAVTPVPGGVGAVTTAVLAAQVAEAAKGLV